MSVALLDVNVLVALFDPQHVHHEAAQRWFGRYRRQGWASCPLTINSCIRILSNPAYPVLRQTPAEIAGWLRDACASTDHHFWPDSVSLLDESLFQPSRIAGHRQLSDVYLLGLAVRNHGRLATFDRSIPLKAVTGAGPGSLTLI